jgi:hypothetical protein
MKMTVFWIVAPCSLVEASDVSEVLAASIIRAMMEAVITLIMEATSTSVTSVNFYQATRHDNTEDSHLRLAAVRTLNLTIYL